MYCYFIFIVYSAEKPTSNKKLNSIEDNREDTEKKTTQ